jgi:hypothetical protein
MLVPTLYLLLSLFQPSVKTEEAVMVGKWKLSRKVPLEGPNRCFVDNLTFYDNNEFELVFKTIISSVEKVYTYTGKVNNQGDANIVLGNGVAYLNKIDFSFEYGENLGMFCTREKHPFPHKHLPHGIKGEKITP